MESPADKYLREHSSRQSETLDWIEKQTNIHTNYPRMLSGAVQGRLLTMLVEISKAKRILEIGAFTGKLWQDPVPQDKQTQGIIAFNDLIVSDPRVESVLLPLRDGLNVIRKL